MSGSQPSAELEHAARAHRQVAAIVAAADRAGVATAELPGVRARLAAREQRLTEWASRIGAPLPPLTPTPSEIASAGPALGDLSDAAARAAIGAIGSTLDAADAAMVAAGAAATVDSTPGTASTSPAATATRGVAAPYGQQSGADQPTQRPQWDAAAPAPPPAPTAAPPTPPTPTPTPTSGPGGWLTRSVYLRNAAIYGGYAFVVFGVQMMLFLLLDETTLPAAAPACLLVLPALAWAAGYLTIGAVFRAPPHGKLERTPRLGVLVSLIPNALLCGMLGLLFVADAVN